MFKSFGKLLGHTDDTKTTAENEDLTAHSDGNEATHPAEDSLQSKSGTKPATPPADHPSASNVPAQSKHITTAVRHHRDDSDDEMYVAHPEKNVPCDINQMAMSLAQLEKRLNTTEHENFTLRQQLEQVESHLHFKPTLPEAVDPDAQHLKIPIIKIGAGAHRTTNTRDATDGVASAHDEAEEAGGGGSAYRTQQVGAVLLDSGRRHQSHAGNDTTANEQRTHDDNTTDHRSSAAPTGVARRSVADDGSEARTTGNSGDNASPQHQQGSVAVQRAIHRSSKHQRPVAGDSSPSGSDDDHRNQTTPERLHNSTAEKHLSAHTSNSPASGRAGRDESGNNSRSRGQVDTRSTNYEDNNDASPSHRTVSSKRAQTREDGAVENIDSSAADESRSKPAAESSRTSDATATNFLDESGDRKNAKKSDNDRTAAEEEAVKKEGSYASKKLPKAPPAEHSSSSEGSENEARKKSVSGKEKHSSRSNRNQTSTDDEEVGDDEQTQRPSVVEERKKHQQKMKSNAIHMSEAAAAAQLVSKPLHKLSEVEKFEATSAQLHNLQKVVYKPTVDDDDDKKSKLAGKGSSPTNQKPAAGASDDTVHRSADASGNQSQRTTTSGRHGSSSGHASSKKPTDASADESRRPEAVSSKTTDANATNFVDESGGRKSGKKSNNDRTAAEEEAVKKDGSYASKHLPKAPPAEVSSSSEASDDESRNRNVRGNEKHKSHSSRNQSSTTNQEAGSARPVQRQKAVYTSTVDDDQGSRPERGSPANQKSRAEPFDEPVHRSIDAPANHRQHTTTSGRHGTSSAHVSSKQFIQAPAGEKQRPKFSANSGSSNSSRTSSPSPSDDVVLAEVNDDVRPLPNLPASSHRYGNVVAASHQQYEQEIASHHQSSRTRAADRTTHRDEMRATAQRDHSDVTTSRHSAAPHGGDQSTYYANEAGGRGDENDDYESKSSNRHVSSHEQPRQRRADDSLAEEDTEPQRSVVVSQHRHESGAASEHFREHKDSRQVAHDKLRAESGTNHSAQRPEAVALELHRQSTSEQQHLSSINPEKRADSSRSSSRRSPVDDNDHQHAQYETDAGQKYSVRGPMADIIYPVRHEVAELDLNRQSLSVYSSRSSHAVRNSKISNSTNSSSVTAQKRAGVRGESTLTAHSVELLRVEKSDETKQLIRAALMDNCYLGHLDKVQIGEMAEYMYTVSAPEKCWIARQGEEGNHLYVLASGLATVEKDGEKLRTLEAGASFGEHAMLHSAPRSASVKSIEPCQLWVLDRKVYKKVMMKSHTERREEEIRMLEKVPTLSALSPHRLKKLADALEVEFYSPGEYIMRQGEMGDHLHIILHGKANAVQSDENEHEGAEIERSNDKDQISSRSNDRVVKTLKKGDYFGEKALEGEHKRTMSVIATKNVECLVLHRDAFENLVGHLHQHRASDKSPYHHHQTGLDNRSADDLEAIDKSSSPRPPRRAAAEQNRDSEAQLFTQKPAPADFKTLATLGVGAFGRVVLVEHPAVPGKAFALKVMKKVDLVKFHQEVHVRNEKDALLQSRSPFICKLYFAMKDSKRLYFLFEYLAGGELWSKLRDLGRFDEPEVQFYSACVLAAIEYLHEQNIAYRDLKPENVILDARGYGKLIDMGFAKHVEPHKKTWTFCGTPLYIAPEIILHKGHDQAVDFYELGIFMYELYNGTSPFDRGNTGPAENDPETYKQVLRGIDTVEFPQDMPDSLSSLVKSLCKLKPAERLGNLRGGSDDIKRHRFFQGFDWSALESQSLVPPIQPYVEGPLDTSNFDESFPPDSRRASTVPDDTSGWDKDF